MKVVQGVQNVPTKVVLDAQSYLADIPGDFMQSSDVLILLSDGLAVRAHSQILASHSAVLSSMLADLTSSKGQAIPVPLCETHCGSCLCLSQRVGVFATKRTHWRLCHSLTVRCWGNRKQGCSRCTSGSSPALRGSHC